MDQRQTPGRLRTAGEWSAASDGLTRPTGRPIGVIGNATFCFIKTIVKCIGACILNELEFSVLVIFHILVLVMTVIHNSCILSRFI